ncbi:hypothetical protein [Salinarimonas soli]|uniref:Uncharacterized protein n=1 Tax=Salinarimonas soli TaxID=1638099 RepID=A0A5B2VXA3_9HYPH|nr:hypothetical protein [Salinarimonas soli]KAA2243961.1 hypothetical protein F0L46_01540 [Salinarimonas soli]
MKKLIIAAGATVLLASPVLAQANLAPYADSLERTQGNQSHIGGDNQQAGGPSEARRDGYGVPYGYGASVGGRVVRGAPGVVIVDPVETGSIVGVPADPSVPGSSTASPFSRTQGNNAHTGGDLVPSFQQGDNQQAGGPANELIRQR